MNVGAEGKTANENVSGQRAHHAANRPTKRSVKETMRGGSPRRIRRPTHSRRGWLPAGGTGTKRAAAFCRDL
ncbi:hypothetical protein C7S13_3996 [Burkholderia cepacia]|nr:hypothetical protein [Burkholderia cepacia]